ncbi:hypothetical protein FDECE_10722 [Fusarium decemcellulare]|nr:hypothetical protein FDECE_10722 [Fusarium decemcellulare]
MGDGQWQTGHFSIKSPHQGKVSPGGMTGAGLLAAMGEGRGRQGWTLEGKATFQAWARLGLAGLGWAGLDLGSAGTRGRWTEGRRTVTLLEPSGGTVLGGKESDYEDRRRGEWRDTRSRADFRESLGTDLEGEIEHDGDDAVRWGEGEKGGSWQRAGYGIVLNACESDSVSRGARRNDELTGGTYGALQKIQCSRESWICWHCLAEPLSARQPVDAPLSDALAPSTGQAAGGPRKYLAAQCPSRAFNTCPTDLAACLPFGISSLARRIQRSARSSGPLHPSQGASTSTSTFSKHEMSPTGHPSTSRALS